MKNTKEMHASCLYLFEGESSSSSCFIQNKEDAKSFMILANYYLSDFLKIYEYNLTKDSWVMIVKIRSREKIFKSYKHKREKSSTCNRAYDHTKIWKIISEQMRQFLNHYVKAANKRSGREGTLVKGPYKRSFFENIGEVTEHIKAIRSQLLKRKQKLKKYRGRKKFFKIAKEKITGHVFLCSRWKNSKKEIHRFFRKFDVDLSELISLQDFMAPKFIEFTKFSHSIQNNP